MNIQEVKQRFNIIGNDTKLNRAIEKAIIVAPTDISVLITGESGVGKEVMPRIIHSLSNRKHGKYIAVNCGAIPEGTIDSELFGHEKGSFTGATSARSGYFEEANGGTIFLDEVGELPLTTQVRLLRVLENGEFLKVGSSVVQKTNVRIVAATNVKMIEAIEKGKFREDLYYRLSTVEINLPPLRERKEDIHLIFRKFASDFAEKYRMPAVQLSPEAVNILSKYRFNGNIRQLRNIAEQISVLEKNRDISAEQLLSYLPEVNENLPIAINNQSRDDFSSEKEFLYKLIIEMKREIESLKTLTYSVIDAENIKTSADDNEIIRKVYPKEIQNFSEENNHQTLIIPAENSQIQQEVYPYIEEIPEAVSLQEKEIELIKKSLERHNGKRKEAALELGISERTLFRKIKNFNLK